MNRFAFVIAIVALSVLPAAALAQVPQQVINDPPIAYGAGAGVSVPVGDAEDVLERGFVVQGMVRFKINDSIFMPRFDVEYHKFDLKTGSVGSGTSSILSGALNLHLFLSGGTIRPYAVGGIGLYRVNYDVDGISGTPGYSDGQTRFGLNGGGGLAFRVGPRMNVYGEIRLVNILTDEGAVDSALQTAPLTFGITY